MSSSVEDTIELLELNSPSSTKSLIRGKLKIGDNKVGSPPVLSPTRSEPQNDSSHLFAAKARPPQPKPRLQPLSKRRARRSSKTATDLTSESLETPDSFRDFASSAPSLKSDTRSYRERLKERFESVKRQAGRSASKAQTFKSRADRIRGLKRSINLMRKENEEIESVLRDYESSKTPSAEGTTNRVSKVEACRFFCEENVGNEDAATIGKSTEVLIDITNKDTDDNVQYSKAENLEFNIKASETSLFWQPSSKPLKVTDKLEEEEPRILADEGFFVERTPSVPVSHLNILEQRLLSIDDKKWFNCEGKLNILPNPYVNKSYRPNSYNQSNPDLETEYVQATVDAAITEKLFLPNDNILEILISSLKFKHHPLFSPEHVYEQELIELIEAYNQKVNANKLERISKRLDAIRVAKRNLEAMLENRKVNFKKIQAYANDIKKLREIQFEEGKQIREGLKAILQTWKRIKAIRQTNNYSSTTIKLNIRKEKCSYEREKPEWDTKVQEICSEIISERTCELEQNMEVYKEKLEEWKTHMQDEYKISEDLPAKPKKPIVDIDEDSIKEDVLLKFKESFKPPGEPILHFNLCFDHDVTDKVDNIKEKLRRNAVATTKLYLRVLCNKIEVCKSKTLSLNDTFVCSIDESFSIQLLTVPEHIKIEVHEQPSTLMKRKLGDVNIPVPTQNSSTKHGKATEKSFQKDEIVHYKHEGVGSGIEQNEKTLYTSGVITCQMVWDINDASRQSFQENHEPDLIKQVLNEDGSIDINNLIRWADENNPDPQDPKNSVLYEYIKSYDDDIRETQNVTKEYFRRNPEMAPFEFCDAKDIEENPRFQFLKLRDRNEPEFVGMVVPNRIKELPLGVLEDYRRRRDEEAKGSVEEDYSYDDDEIDSKHSRGRKYLKQVYTKVFQQCRNMQNNLAYEDVVNEKVISHIESIARNIISTIVGWFQFQPYLSIRTPKPIRKSSSKMTDLSTSVKIKINVKSAVNVPSRNTTNSPRSEANKTVKPFVVATYQHVSLETSSVEGTNPTWNEELVLPLDSSNTDYLSPNALSGSIVIQLFDEITIKGRTGNVNSKLWLGSTEIPVSAIAYNNKMEGLFEIQKPINLFNYEQDVDDNSLSSRSNTARQTPAQHTYLSLKISFQPDVPKLTQDMDELETSELPYLKQHILNWNESYNNEHSNRKFSALCIDVNGKTNCVTRYIRPLEPPQLNVDRFDASAEQCARYVSMIPFTDNNKFYQNVWLTTEQLLKFMTGSIIDHAIALTCYLTSLDLEVWLLLGYGIPHGSTAYVFLREYVRDQQAPSHSVYDVVTATKYDIMDNLCPLQKVFCVINEHNVWANTQRTDHIQLTRFDFLRRSDWLPLFTKRVPAPTNSVQQKLVYSVTPNIKELEIRIDKKIRKKVTKARTHERTIWNHELSRAFKHAIVKNEAASMHGRRNSEMVPEIRQVASTNSIYGYIANVPYTSISTIVATILSTGVQLHEDSNVEFGLAVEICPYPNHVLAVWICFAAILKRA